MSTASLPARPRPWPRWVRILGWSALGLIGVGSFFSVVVLTFGGVRGTEFCPQTFERRTYAFHVLPVVGVQLTPLEHEDKTATAETYLTANNLVTPPGPQRTWHLVSGTRGTRPAQRGDAQILITYLDSLDGKDYHRWVQWSEDHPARAKAFWPAVQLLALHELYVFVPDLFDLAKSIDDPQQLRQALDRTVAEKLRLLAARLEAGGQADAAKKARREADRLAPPAADAKNNAT